MEWIKVNVIPVIVGAFVAWLFLTASAQETERQMEWMKYLQIQQQNAFQLEMLEKDINIKMEDIRNQLDGIYHEMDNIKRK